MGKCPVFPMGGGKHVGCEVDKVGVQTFSKEYAATTTLNFGRVLDAFQDADELWLELEVDFYYGFGGNGSLRLSAGENNRETILSYSGSTEYVPIHQKVLLRCNRASCLGIYPGYLWSVDFLYQSMVACVYRDKDLTFTLSGEVTVTAGKATLYTAKIKY